MLNRPTEPSLTRLLLGAAVSVPETENRNTLSPPGVPGTGGTAAGSPAASAVPT